MQPRNPLFYQQAGSSKLLRGDGMTHKELIQEADMLQGNINRMMVTDDKNELMNMYSFALRRLEKIYRERVYVLWEVESETDIPK